MEGIQNIDARYKDTKYNVNIDDIDSAKRVLPNHIENYTSDMIIEGKTFLNHVFALIRY